MKIAGGDEVRVHFHPPGPMKSFCEGAVRRVDLTSPEGRFFTVEVTHEVILDREHRVRPGFQDYVRYEDRNDFPGRIEILSGTAQEAKPAPVQVAMQPSEEVEREAGQEAQEPHSVELEAQLEREIVPAPEAEAEVEPVQVDVEPEPVRKPRGLMAALFGRKT